MKLFGNLCDVPETLRRGAVSIGNFDGVHRGHARIVERLRALAARVGGPAVVFTFDPHPVRLLRPAQAPPPLTWTDRKAELLAELGVDAVVAYPTDQTLLDLSADEFFAQIVRGQLDARAMVEGPNFHFGHNRQGNIHRLGELTAAAGLLLEVVEPLEIGGRIVSSSRVREAIAAGAVDEARQLLTNPYRIRGMVTHGAARGAKIGFPTANIDAIDTLVPGAGVYAGVARTTESRDAATGAGASRTNRENWPAAINVGPNPTFGEHALKVEVHLIGYAGSLYGAPLEVDFLSRLRDTRPFAGVAELQRQLRFDVEQAAQIAQRALNCSPSTALGL